MQDYIWVRYVHWPSLCICAYLYLITFNSSSHFNGLVIFIGQSYWLGIGFSPYWAEIAHQAISLVDRSIINTHSSSQMLLTQPDGLLPSSSCATDLTWWGEGHASPLNPGQHLSPPPVTRQGRGNPIITRLYGTPPVRLPAFQMFPIKKEAFHSQPIFCMLRERAWEQVEGKKNGFLLIQKGR